MQKQSLLRYVFAAALMASCIASSSLQATDTRAHLPYGGQTILAVDEYGRTLYDRNKATREYQRQRGEANCYYGCYNGYYYYNPGQDTTYCAPAAHPDAAGNEDR